MKLVPMRFKDLQSLCIEGALIDKRVEVAVDGGPIEATIIGTKYFPGDMSDLFFFVHLDGRDDWIPLKFVSRVDTE